MPRSAAHLVETRWKPGVSANPAGRPKGSRSKLIEAFLAKMNEDFQVHGEAVIAKVRESQPGRYLQCVAALVPAQTQKVESPFADLSDAELDQLQQLLAALRAKNVKTLNQAEPATRNQRQPERISDERQWLLQGEVAK
jgi:Family of unknown function (DUF5681)